MEIDAAEIEKQGKKAVAVLERLTSVHVPKTIKDALNEDWLALFQDEGLDIMSAVPKAELKAWGSRAVTMRDANLALRIVEETLVKEFVKSAESPFVIATRRLTAIPKFVLSHLGEIVSFALPLTASAIQDGAELEALELINEARKAEYDEEAAKDAPDFDFLAKLSKEMFIIQAEAEAIRDRFTVALAAIMGIVGYWTVERLVSMAATVAAYKAKMVKVVALNLSTQGNAKAWAMPQRKRKSYRKRKVSRR